MMAPQQQIPPPVGMALLPLPSFDVKALEQITNPNERKQLVGNAIYPIIEQVYQQQLAGRITGMLLDENVINFTHLLTNQAYLTQKAYEAFSLLQQSFMAAQVAQAQSMAVGGIPAQQPPVQQ